MEKHFVSFEEFVALCKNLAEQIKNDKFKSDIIIGVSRGGWIPARFLSDYLKVDFIASVGVSYYVLTKKKEKPQIIEKLSVDIKGLKVLVVDETVDTGESLELVRDYLASFKPAKMKFVVLHYKPWSKFKPDYYARETMKWPVYPWEELENNRGD